MDMLEKEARIFAHYLVGRDANSQAIRIYKEAMRGSKPNTADKKLLRFMTKHPRTIGFIDAGLVFHDSTSEARRRLYIMLANLEASPENCDLFLPKQRGPLYIFTVCYSGIRAIVKAVLGLVLVKVVV